MRDLFIVGAGGFGREAVWTVERINKAAQQPLWNVIGFADDDPAKATGNFEGYPMLGSVTKASADHPGASVFIAIGASADQPQKSLRHSSVSSICRPGARPVGA